jgi:hypothetical protein
MENSIAGGYTSFRSFNLKEEELFEKVIKQITGVQYTPLVVASQVVNGTNYAFLCESKVVGPNPDAVSYNTLVIIHQPLPQVNEVPLLLEIKTVKII